jgi:hypothetical protein
VLWLIPVSHSKDGQTHRPGAMLAFAGNIGGSQILNVAVVDQGDLEKMEMNGWNAALVKGYAILKYEIDGDKVSVWEMSDKTRRKAVEAGKVKGNIKERFCFTDTTENLAKFLADPANADLFDKKTTYQRVK